MSQIKAKSKKYIILEDTTNLNFKNLITAMKNDIFRLSIPNDKGEPVYITGTEYIKDGIKMYMTDGTEFKLIKG